MNTKRVAVAVGLASVAAISTGIGLIYLPAGVIAAGLQGLGVAYLVAYFGGRGTK